tara:strand:+ start:3071 stop:4933 length:1863 start_codon:yes stop_codon:yes gene_type:complete
MISQNHYIQGRKVNPPANWEDIDIEINFQPDDSEVGLSVSTFDWVNEEYDIIKSYFDSGLTGGNGTFEGLPHKIEILQNGTVLNVFDGYIDLTTAQWDQDRVTAESKQRAGIDWLNEVADSFTFEYLYDQGRITNADKIFVPYVINSIPDYRDIFIATLSLYTVTTQLKDVSFDVGKGVAQTAPLISAISGILELIFRILYTAFLIVSVVKLILDLFNLIIQPVKYAAGMKVNTMLTAACGHLGLNYESPVLQKPPFDKLTIIPNAQNPPPTQTDQKIKGYFLGNQIEQTGYYDGTFGDLLRALSIMFNLRVVSSPTKVQLLPKLKSITSASFRLPKYDIQKWRTNADEFISNYTVSFRSDSVDGNTIDQWTGTNYQVQLVPKTPPSDRRLVLMKGLNRVSIPFARAYRKNDLTGLEKTVEALMESFSPVLNALISVINGVTTVVNGVLDAIRKVIKALKTIGIRINFNPEPISKIEKPRIKELIENRIGMLLLEKDMIGVDKICLVDVGSDQTKNKINLNNDTIIRASYLWNNFHHTNSFAPKADTAQRYEYEYENVEMNLSDVTNVLNEGVVYTNTGNLAEVISCSWNSSTQLANFVIREKKIYSNNLQERTDEPTGR